MTAMPHVLPVPDLRPAPLRWEDLSALPGVRRGMPSGPAQQCLELPLEHSRTRSEEAELLSHLPPVADHAAKLAQALVEVMGGTRPAPQVIRFVAPDIYSVLARRWLTASRRGLGGARRSVVRRVRVFEPASGVAEVSAVIMREDRVTAMALRLEGFDGRWIVTALSVC
jgi:hypothetical protein